MSLKPIHFDRSSSTGRQQNAGRVLLLCVLIALTGCRSSASYAKLEQELRGKDAHIRQIESRLADSQAKLQEQDQQLTAHRMLENGFASGGQFATVSRATEGGPADGSSVPEEVLAAWGSVRELRIQKLVSGIRWDSGKPVLHVVVRPVDADGELRKVAGQLSVQARPLTGQQNSDVLAEQSWTITESRHLWSSGFVSSGFHTQIPIGNHQAARHTKQLQVTATLRLGQGRTFEVSEILNVPKTAPLSSTSSLKSE